MRREGSCQARQRASGFRVLLPARQHRIGRGTRLRAAKQSPSGALTQKQIAWASGYFFVLVLLIGLQGTVWPSKSVLGQKPGQSAPDALRVNVDLVVLHATVENRSHSLVSGLRKEDFQVYEDGMLQRIESFSDEDIPVTVGLVVDNSGSMMLKHREVIAAALAFARSSNPEDQLFVVHFNEHVWFGLPADTLFTDREPQLKAALSRINADGKTALYDATAAALEHLKKGKWDKKVLVVISDGADNASKHSRNEVMALAEKSNVILYTVGLFQPEDHDANPGVLKEFAQATGGEVLLPESLKKIVPISEQIARDIRSQYTITYVPTNTKQDGAYRAVEVKARASGHGRLRVRTRAGYYARLKPPPLPASGSAP